MGSSDGRDAFRFLFKQSIVVTGISALLVFNVFFFCYSGAIFLMFSNNLKQLLLIHPRQRGDQESWKRIMYRAYCINSDALILLY